MRIFTQKALFVLFLTSLFSTTQLKAQYANVDTNFASLCEAFFPGSTLPGQLDTTHAGITSVTSWNISGYTSYINGIRYFDNLEYLYCNNNYISTLPILPPNLKHFECRGNYIGSFPSMPSTLRYLDCSDTYVNGPSLAWIASSNLDTLICWGNFIGTFPTLPNSLKFLDCNTSAVGGVFPSLPSSLKVLYANDNGITTLPSLPNGLEILWIESNYITSLPAILPPALKHLNYNFNSISSLPSSFPPNLLTFYCAVNGIVATTLPDLPPGLLNLQIQGNFISCLPVLPDTLYYFYINGNPITCLPNYPQILWSYDVNPTSLPTCTLGSGCEIGYNISGKTYYDTNLDCGYQSGELLLAGPMKLYQSGALISQTYNTGGYYAFDTPGLGNFDVIVDTTGLPIEYVCFNPGLDSNITLLVSDSVVNNVDFGFKCKPGYDVGVQNVNAGVFFPGLPVTMNFNAGDMSLFYMNNICNSVGISGSIQITVNGPVNYVSPAPGSLTPAVAGNVFTYSISDFSLVDVYNDFKLLFVTDTSANTGDQICLDVVVSSSGTENNYSNNFLNHCFSVVNSYDPNIKEVSPIGNLSYPFNDRLTYTIHFQNTGNASAINIRVADILDSDLDETTFRLLGSSHPLNATVTGNVVEFKFTNINLIDSNSNEPASHGYVQYSIQPDANLLPGTLINNTANIFFDYNSPITTNTTINTIVAPFGIEHNDEIVVNIYPNPASDFLMVQFEQSSTDRYVQLVDLMGRVILQKELTSASNSLPLFELPNGIYSVKIIENTSETVRKIIVSH